MQIKVTFVDLSGRYQLSEVEMDESQLPATFELDTTMHFGELQFQVRSARPVDFRKTGALRLEMWPVESIEPAKILFSIPSLADRLPPLAPPWEPGCYQLHEDDWRQIELVDAERHQEIEHELRCVSDILSNQRQGEGFKTVHVRQLEHPLAGVSLTLAELEQALPPERRSRGLTLRGEEGVIPDGYAYATRGGLVVFGQAPEGRVSTVCLQLPGPAEGLPALMEKHGLVLIDWCAARRVDPNRLEDDDPGYPSNRF